MNLPIPNLPNPSPNPPFPSASCSLITRLIPSILSTPQPILTFLYLSLVMQITTNYLQVHQLLSSSSLLLSFTPFLSPRPLPISFRARLLLPSTLGLSVESLIKTRKDLMGIKDWDLCVCMGIWWQIVFLKCLWNEKQVKLIWKAFKNEEDGVFLFWYLSSFQRCKRFFYYVN